MYTFAPEGIMAVMCWAGSSLSVSIALFIFKKKPEFLVLGNKLMSPKQAMYTSFLHIMKTTTHLQCIVTILLVYSNATRDQYMYVPYSVYRTHGYSYTCIRVGKDYLHRLCRAPSLVPRHK